MNDIIFTKDEVIKIAKEQKTLCWLFLGILVSYPLYFIYVGIFTEIILSLWAIFVVYHLAIALKDKHPGLYAFGMFIPIVKLFVLLNVVQNATKILRANNITVGVMGAKKITTGTLTEKQTDKFSALAWLTCKKDIGKGPRRLLVVASVPLFLLYIIPGILFWLLVKVALWIIKGFKEDRASHK